MRIQKPKVEAVSGGGGRARRSQESAPRTVYVLPRSRRPSRRSSTRSSARPTLRPGSLVSRGARTRWERPSRGSRRGVCMHALLLCGCRPLTAPWRSVVSCVRPDRARALRVRARARAPGRVLKPSSDRPRTSRLDAGRTAWPCGDGTSGTRCTAAGAAASNLPEPGRRPRRRRRRPANRPRGPPPAGRRRLLPPQGDLLHWARLLDAFDAYLEQNASGRPDVQLEPAPPPAPFPSAGVLAVLGATAAIFESCGSNKQAYSSFEVGADTADARGRGGGRRPAIKASCGLAPQPEADGRSFLATGCPFPSASWCGALAPTRPPRHPRPPRPPAPLPRPSPPPRRST
jgi:hypothetical protein